VNSLRKQDGGQISANFQVKMNDIDELLVLRGRGFRNREIQKSTPLIQRMSFKLKERQILAKYRDRD